MQGSGKIFDALWGKEAETLGKEEKSWMRRISKRCGYRNAYDIEEEEKHGEYHDRGGRKRRKKFMGRYVVCPNDERKSCSESGNQNDEDAKIDR